MLKMLHNLLVTIPNRLMVIMILQPMFRICSDSCRMHGLMVFSCYKNHPRGFLVFQFSKPLHLKKKMKGKKTWKTEALEPLATLAKVDSHYRIISYFYLIFQMSHIGLWQTDFICNGPWSCNLHDQVNNVGGPRNVTPVTDLGGIVFEMLIQSRRKKGR